MGFYPQPNEWTCGPFALKNALIMHGILVDEKQISRIAGTHWWTGTNEIQLGKAAKAFGCDLQMVRRYHPEKARRVLVSYLRRGIPTLLCVQEWSHWIAVVKEEKGKFILLDSVDPAVLTIASWSTLRKTWVYHEQDQYDEESIHTIYDLHPVIPTVRVKTRANFSLARARYLRHKSNRTFARLWDEYLEDLLAICKARTPQSEKVFSLGEFLRRHESMILDQIVYWHGIVERRAARKILQNMHLVADTYGLVVHEEDEKRAIAGLTSVLMLWAADKYGVDAVYEAAPKGKRGR